MGPEIAEWFDSLPDDQGPCDHSILHLHLLLPWSASFIVYGPTRPSTPSQLDLDNPYVPKTIEEGCQDIYMYEGQNQITVNMIKLLNRIEG